MINITNLVLINTISEDSTTAMPLINIGTVDNGECNLVNSTFSSNHLKYTGIYVESSVGVFNFDHNVIYNETIDSGNYYMVVAEPYSLRVHDIEYSNISDDHSSDSLTELIAFESIDIETQGVILMDDIRITNVSISFFGISSVHGHVEYEKYIVIELITIQDCYYDSTNPIISFGPFYTDEHVHLVLRNSTFENLEFTNTAKILDIHWQAPVPLHIESCVFTNNVGGYVDISPVSDSDDSHEVILDIIGLEVTDNDFKTLTFFKIANKVHITAVDLIMSRNSAYFIGTMIKITGADSTVEITNATFSNNNGVTGGLFYIYSRSTIIVKDSIMFSNFAVTSSIAYINSGGKLFSPF